MSLGLDTSVVVRLLVGEPAAQAALAWRALDQAGAPVLVADLVVGEAYFALRHHYRVPHPEAVAALRALLGDPRIGAPGVAGQVLAAMPEAGTGAGLMDRLIVADASARGAVLLTIDAGAAKLTGARLLTA